MGDQESVGVAYHRPSEALARYVTGYHRFAAPVMPGHIFHDAFFPSVATIRVSLAGTPPWSMRVGSRHYDPMPSVALTGPSSYAGYVSGSGGTLVGAGLLPFGWAQMFGGDVSRLSNRVIPLEELDPGAESLRTALESGESFHQVFDSWLEARLQRRPPADPRIDRLCALLRDPGTTRIEAVAEMLEMTPRALAALTRFSFGFTPKLLLRRTRFLRAVSAVLTEPEAAPAALEQAGYWDRSHFLRDSHLFLGCSVREFSRRRGPHNQLAIRARTEALGTPV
ncbi:helix-turn-helix domain-containing protein [Sphingomonas sp. BK235]|uniref:helix-turn-helix domain-containing protein n=1 Tax=Sphingomonas sp. BK235 TaxID=2512131 RepID=UPI001052AFFE|nr:helix-turn-helix domain-containing protein [Sphingomonas sp. BK235]TCP36771.1 AraC family transcriptional regulator [Sphingomonas sp. BK235]